MPHVCIAQARWADIGYGVAVVVTQEDGQRVGGAGLDYGTFDTARRYCTFGFSLGRVIADNGPLQVHVGKASRRAMTFTPQQMAEGPQLSFVG